MVIVMDYLSMNISQFMIYKDYQGFCMEYFERLPKEGEIIVKVSALNYEIKDKTVNYVSSNNDNDDDIFDIFIDDFPDPMYYNFTKKCKTIGRFCRIDEDKIEDIGADYCCGVIAMANVCGGYGFFDKTKNTEIYKAYKKLWSYADVKKVDGEYAMDQNKIGKAMQKYYKDKTGKTLPYEQKENPTTQFFIDAVDKKYSSILGVYSKREGGKSGHAVSVEGYFIFEPLNEIVYGEKQIFLSVATGWDSEQKYIWYDKVNLDSTYGVVFKLYK